MQVALITGASSGIGAGVARELHRRGYAVGLMARREVELQALADELAERVAWRAVDVTDRAALESAVAALEDELGPCTQLVASAGVGDTTSARKLDADRVLRVMRVNYDGVVYAIGAVLPGMIARGAGVPGEGVLPHSGNATVGRIAAISSLAGERGMPRSGAYSASKAAVSNFLESLRVDLRQHGITVTTVKPGFVDTPMTQVNAFPMPFLMPVDHASRVICDGLEAGRPVVAFPWQMALVVGALRRLPVWLFDLLMGRAFPKGRRRA